MFSWDGVDSSSEEEIDSPSSDSVVGNAFRFRGSSEEDSEEDVDDDNGGGYNSDDNDDDGSSADNSSSEDGGDSDGGSMPARNPKHRRYLGTYWW